MVKITTFVRRVPIYEQVFWCIAMILAIALCLAAMIALWQFGKIGSFALGFCACWLMRR